MTHTAGLSRFRLGTRLAFGFGALILLIAALTAMGISRVGSIRGSLAAINDVNSVKQRYAINFRGSVHDRAIALRDVTLVASPEQVDAEIALIRKLADDYARSAGPLEAMLARADATPDERAALDGIKQVEARALPLTDQVIALRRTGNDAEAIRLLQDKARAAYVDWLAAINRFIDLEEARNKAESGQARAVAQGFQSLMLGLCAAAIVVAAIVGWLIARSILGELGTEPATAADLVRAISRGDLRVPIQVRAGDDRSLLAALRQMQQGLQAMVLAVRQNAESVATASGQISQGNSDLSGRTEEQASALQQTAASMKQLASTVKQNADSAQQGNALAVNASSVAARGGEVVGQVVETMKGINDSSRRIADIISVIDGIAFQTNILALNAAVEAARAGEQGRGFAVVAGEVRTLAQRSADAAKEIKGLIAASVERVEEGSTLVDQAGTTMEEVVASIKHVTDLMGEISAASREQSSGVAQIEVAVHQMDRATQQNAALVEESAAAADSLKVQARQLVGAVAVFNIGGHEASNAQSLGMAPMAAGTVARKPQAGTGAPTRARTAGQPRRAGTDDDWQTF